MTPSVLVIGKVPPPFIGPAVATGIILNSDILKQDFKFYHVKTNLNRSFADMEKFKLFKLYRLIGIWFSLFLELSRRPDLVYLTTISQSPAGFIKDSFYILFSRLFRRKVIFHLRGSNWQGWLSHAHPFIRWYAKKVIRMTQGAIVLSEKFKELFADLLPHDRIFVAANGIDLTFPFTNKNVVPKVIFLSNLIPNKGIEDFLLACSLLEKDGVKFEAEVVGAWNDTDFKKHCLNTVEKLNSVRFYGPLTGIEKLNKLASADVFVFVPRAPEGLPWVIIEALAANLPIIATDQGAICEGVKSDENGFIVDPRDPCMIAQKMKLLFLNPESRAKMGNKSGEIYRNNFTAEKMANQLSAIFHKVILDEG